MFQGKIGVGFWNVYFICSKNDGKVCFRERLGLDFGMFEVPKVTLKEWARMR